MQAQVKKTVWDGLDAVELTAGGYKAMVLPGIGGNLIELEHPSKKVSILKGPKNAKEYQGFPSIYGIPILFPPNRIDRGTFTFQEMAYQFPINEKDRNNSLHGFLENYSWTVKKAEAKDNQAVVALEVKNDSSTSFFQYYPHRFTITITYILSEEGLKQEAKVKNESGEPMPMGLGFHTAFQLPYFKESKKENIKVRFSIKERIDLNERLLPTGKYLPLDEEEQKFRTEGQSPLYTAMDNHFSSSPIERNGEAFHGVILEDSSTDLKIIYEVGAQYKHWMIWNHTGNEDFVCIEPQTWMINAPNMNFSKEQTGLVVLQPNEEFIETARLFIEE